MNKIKLIFPSLLGAFFLYTLIFSLSSKDTQPGTSYDDCNKLKGEEFKIQINFSSAPIIGRKTGFKQYVPYPDIRNGNYPGASSRKVDDDYYCVIVISTPGCTDWSFRKVYDANSTFNGKVVTVKQPPVGYDTTIKVTYYERRDVAPYSQRFNKDYNSRIVYNFEKTYFGGIGTKIPEPIYLTAMGIDGQASIGPIDVSGVGDLNKLPTISDYGSINEFIEINNINP